MTTNVFCGVIDPKNEEMKLEKIHTPVAACNQENGSEMITEEDTRCCRRGRVS